MALNGHFLCCHLVSLLETFAKFAPKRSKAGDFSLPVKGRLQILTLLMLSSFSLRIRSPLRCLLDPGALPQNWLQHVTLLHSMTLLCPKIDSRAMAAFPSKVIKIQRACYFFILLFLCNGDIYPMLTLCDNLNIFKFKIKISTS